LSTEGSGDAPHLATLLAGGASVLGLSENSWDGNADGCCGEGEIMD
jgi:hypothetical protein